MAAPRSFRLYQEDGVTPKTDATPTFDVGSGGIYSTRAGVARTPPVITHLGGGVYQYLASDADEAIGVCALTAAIPNALPSRVAGSVSTASSPFHVFHFYDVDGNLWAGSAPTVTVYKDTSGVDQAAPSLVAVAGAYLYSLTPTGGDLTAGRHYAVGGVTDSYPRFYSDIFYLTSTGSGTHRDPGFNRGFN